MTKTELENALREQYLTILSNALSNACDADALAVSSNELAVPCVDAEGNERFVVFKVSIPRGTRNGNGYDPYDAYAAAEAYALEVEEKKEKKAAAEKKKQEKIERDKQKRAEKEKEKEKETA